MAELTEEQKNKIINPNRELYFVDPWDSETETPTKYPESMYELDPQKVIAFIEQLLTEVERRAVEKYKRMTFCNGVGKVHAFTFVSEGRENEDYYQIQRCELCGFTRKVSNSYTEDLSQLQDKITKK